MLISVPLERPKETAECSVELIGVDLLVRLDAVRKNLSNILRYFGSLAHVHGCAFQFACRVYKGQIRKTAAEFLLFKGCENQPALTFLSSTTGAAKAMDVRVALAGETDLNNVRDVGEVHTSGRDVGREEDARLAEAEVVCGPSPLGLGEFGVDFETAHTGKGRVALEAATELVEDGGSESDFCSAVEVDNGFERTRFAGLGELVLLENEFVQSRYDIFKAGDVDVFLRDSLMCWLLVFLDTLGKVEARAHCPAHEINDIAGNCGGEHQVLALDFGGIRQKVLNLIDLLCEAIIEQTIGLVHDQRVQVRGPDAGIIVRENIVDTAWCADEEMTSFALRLLEHGPLLCSADCDLHNDAGIGNHLLGLDRDLLGQFSRRGDDDGSDVVWFGALVSAGLLAQLRVVLDDSLDNGDEEAEGFARTGLCLRNTIES